MLQQLLTRPALGRVLVEAFLKKVREHFINLQSQRSVRRFPNLHEVDSFRPDEILGQLVVQRIYHSRVGDDETGEELVGLEDGHVPRNEVADVLADQIELVDVRFSRPQRLALRKERSRNDCIDESPDQAHIHELDKDAADRPDVHLGAVLRVAHEELRRSVPPRCHVVCEVFSRT